MIFCTLDHTPGFHQIAIGMQVLEQRYCWLSPCWKAKHCNALLCRKTKRLIPDRSENCFDDASRWSIASQCQHMSTQQQHFTLCLSVCNHVSNHSSHLRRNQDTMQSKFFRWIRLRRRFFRQIQLLLIWLGLDVFPSLLVVVLTGHGSPEALWKLGLCRQETLLTQGSLIFGKYPGTLTQPSFDAWTNLNVLKSMHLNMNQITYQLTDKSCSLHILLEHCWLGKCRMFWVQTDSDPKFYSKGWSSQLAILERETRKLTLVKIAWGSPWGLPSLR